MPRRPPQQLEESPRPHSPHARRQALAPVRDNPSAQLVRLSAHRPPGAYGPAGIRALQRSVGNQAVQRMLARQASTRPGNPARAEENERLGDIRAYANPAHGGAPLQRYYVLDPTQKDQDYDTAWNWTKNELFPASQQMSITLEKNVLDFTTRSPEKGFWDNLPRLRVSDLHRMAIEHEAGKEQKTFYASPDIIKQSQDRLTDIGSRNTIATTGGHITIPVGGGATQKLQMVKPVLAADSNAKFANASSECNSAAMEIYNAAQDAEIIHLGDQGQYTTFNSDESMKDIATGIAAPQATPQGLAQNITAARQAPPPPAISEEAKHELLLQFPRIDEIAPKLVAGYADEQTPVSARQEIVLRLRAWPQTKELGWSNEPDLADEVALALGNAWELEGPIDHNQIIRRHRDLAGLSLYASRDPQQDEAFGVNAYAAPEVGETFATLSITPSNFGYSKVDLTMQGQEAQQFLDLFQSQVELTLDAIEHALDVLKQTAPQSWTWHYAGVVAKDGPDVVTLENYNRKSEDRKVLEQKIGELFLNHQHLDEIRENVVGLHSDLQSQAAMRKAGQAKTHYDQSCQDSINTLKQIGIKFTTDVQPAGERWFFQMYGPVNSQPGQHDDQSFHNFWAGQPGEFSNPLTLRLGTVADANFKQAMIIQMEQEVDHKLASWQADAKQTLKQDLAQQIQNAATRVEVSKILREGIPTI